MDPETFDNFGSDAWNDERTRLQDEVVRAVGALLKFSGATRIEVMGPPYHLIIEHTTETNCSH